MSLPRYPEYKDSGVEWLGEVPGHWDVAKTARFFKIAMGQTILKEDLIDDGLWPVFSATDGDHYFGRVNDPQVRLSKGDIVIPARGNSIGAVKLVTEPSTTTQTTIYCKNLARNIFEPNFVFYFMRGCRDNLFWFTNTAIPQITVEEVSSNPILVPPHEEQQFIASFLDRETGKIDALIAEQRRLVELLAEKRQAVISHAVTKGLGTRHSGEGRNPAEKTIPQRGQSSRPAAQVFSNELDSGLRRNDGVVMKNSGIEWLGEVPEHWEVFRLKQLARKLTDGEHISPSLSDVGVPLLSAKDVRDWQVDYDVDKFVTIENANLFWRRCQPEKGDILVVSRGATVGRVGVVESDTAFCLMGSVILCKPEKGFDSAFLYFALNAKHAQTSLWFSSDSSAQQAIYIRDVAEVPVPIPPNAERTAIASFLKDESAKFNTLTAEANRAIALLQERRSALISAAVTGKIDVRRHTGA